MFCILPASSRRVYTDLICYIPRIFGVLFLRSYGFWKIYVVFVFFSVVLREDVEYIGGAWAFRRC